MLEALAGGRSAMVRGAAVLVTVVGAGSALGQTVRITPSVDTRLTWTDNVDVSSGNKQQDWIAEVAPGISISRDSGRFSGRLNAQLRNIGHANESDLNTSFLTLQGRGQIEAVEDALFVDLDSAISRSNLSAFSGRSAADSLNADSNSETRTWSISPRLRFRLWGDADGTVSYTSRWLDSGGELGQRRLDQWTAVAGSPTAFRLFGWGLSYSRNRSDQGSGLTGSAGGESKEESGRATLYINVTPQFRLRAIGGRESNDYESGQSEAGSIYGGGFDWNPTERTTIAATTEERMFGRGYDFSFQHRMARSSWNLRFSKDLSSSLQNLSQGRPLTQEEQLCRQIATVLVQDTVQQQQFYERCLVSMGFDPFASRQTLLTNSHFIEKSLQAGFSLIGVRNVLSVAAVRSDRERVGSAGGLVAGDEFASTDKLVSTSFTLSLSHRLSGMTSLNTSLMHTHSVGASGTDLDTKRLFATVGLTTELGPDTYGGVTYRYQRSEGKSIGSDFIENAITANLGMRF